MPLLVSTVFKYLVIHIGAYTSPLVSGRSSELEFSLDKWDFTLKRLIPKTSNSYLKHVALVADKSSLRISDNDLAPCLVTKTLLFFPI